MINVPIGTPKRDYLNLVVELGKRVTGTQFLVHDALLGKADGSKGCDPFPLVSVDFTLPILTESSILSEEHDGIPQMSAPRTAKLDPDTRFIQIAQDTLCVANRLSRLLLPTWAYDRGYFHYDKSTARMFICRP